ncbi:NAD(P)-dependent alcohol dehydrogenase [Legionella jamestowniensis]|uniref:alcohol dehydrogenase n=1 Tax=Legionella jamestowniensis TaxID=455 RepID=A0A0W0UJD2_9GAMM|nr:NAD(P)-dependent alcohol dehydrogenase [Legionella jamestowniensis]KTD07734.1 alcohol dehydrogenase [Legionella jamestowniensis]SFL61379.1 alcohol dehydrogenase, propanol-preferring [Legionella jamestowniensis DSM 19215]
MLAARMHAYHKPLILEEVPTPGIQPDEVLVKVTAAGMCRTDVQLLDGYFQKYANLPLPLTPGHEIAGIIRKVGSLVPQTTGFAEGDQVVVVGGWGDESCRHCHQGNTQICAHGRWPGFGPYGGYSEFVPVPAKYLIKVDKRLRAEELAPLTDAGLTPYRGIKKLRDAGALGPNRVLGVLGIGGLGSYAVQYAKLLGAGAAVVAFARHPDKLAVAKEYGADYVISTKGKSVDNIRNELGKLVGQTELDAVIDCAGAEEMIRMGFELLSVAGHYSSVGLVGDKINIPLFPFVAREYTYHGSFWGNYNDLSEVLALASQGKIRHKVKLINFEEINENLDLLRSGDIVGRAVIKF